MLEQVINSNQFCSVIVYSVYTQYVQHTIVDCHYKKEIHFS